MPRQKITVYDQYNPPDHPGTINDEPSKTQQQYKDECDINNIMARYTTTGLLPPGTTKTGVYADFSAVSDYFQALALIDNAQDQFYELEAKVRARFNNDPAELLAFIENPDNYDEARKLGMLKEQEAPPSKTGQDGGAPPTAPGTPPPAQP